MLLLATRSLISAVLFVRALTYVGCRFELPSSAGVTGGTREPFLNLRQRCDAGLRKSGPNRKYRDLRELRQRLKGAGNGAERARTFATTFRQTADLGIFGGA